MADNQATLILTAETQRFNQAMDSSRAKVVDITSGISSRFRTMANEVTAHMQGMASNTMNRLEAINDTFNRIKGGVAAVGLVFGATALAIKKVVDDTVALEKAALTMGRQLGIGATEASVLQVALDDVYQDASQLEAGMSKLIKTLNTDEEAITRLGVATRDQNGHFRNQLDIMLDVNSKLSQFKEGTDRNVEGMKIYGKSWKEVEPLMALTRDRMEESRKKAQELGLIVGEQNVAALGRYRAAMNDAGDVMTAIKKVIGDALLPVLTKLAEWWSTIGPAAVTIFKVAIGGLALAFQSLVTGVTAAWQTVNAVVNNIGASIVALGKAAGQAVEGNFEDAGKTLKAIPKTISGHWKDAFGEINKSALETQRLFDSLFGKQLATKGGAGGLGATTSDEDKADSKSGKKSGGASSRVGELETALATERYHFEQRKLAAGSFQEFSKQQEADYWKHVLDTEKLSAKDRDAVQRKFFESSRDVAKANFAAKIEQLKLEESALRKDSDEKIRIAKEIAAAEAQRYGAGSPQAQKSQADVAKVELEVLLEQTKRAIAATKEGSEERYHIAEEAGKKIQETYGLEVEAARVAYDQVKAIGIEEAEFRKKQALNSAEYQAQADKAGLSVYAETIRQRAALGAMSREGELQALEDVKEREFQAERSVLEREMQLQSANAEKVIEIKNKLALMEQRRLAESLAAQREIGTVQRDNAENSARAKIADLNAEIASLRSNSPGRVDLAQQAVGVANASFPSGSKEQGDAAGVLAREEAQAERVAQSERIAASRNGAAERLRIAYEASTQIAATYGEESAAFEESQNTLKAAREEFVSGERASIERQLNFAQAAALQKIQLERETLAQQEQLGEISVNDRISGLQLLAVQEHDIELQILNEKYALYEEDMLKREEISQRKLELERRFQGEVAQLRAQELLQQSADVEAGLQPISNTISRMFNQIADGALTWRKAWQNVARSVRTEAINMAVDIAKNYIKNQILQTQAHLAGNAIRSAADKQSAIMSVAQMAWAAIKIIGMKAWETAVAVYASISNIPYIGPFLAPAMAVGAAALVMGYIGRISSAEGGYDIPAGTNPMTQLHAREMVLPAQYADVIRGMAGDGGSGGGMTIHMPMTVNAIDARGVDKILMERSSTIARAVAKEVRDGRSLRS